MLLAAIVRHLDALAPPHTAEAWDNVGLLVGDASGDVSNAILCIDYTATVAEEAKAAGCDFVLAYHPPVFKPLKRVTADGASALVFDAIRRGVAIYSPHTALDVAEGGTNDVLADVLGLVERRPLKLSESKSTDLRLVTFVPSTDVDRVADALFAAGAGALGNYSRCDFRVEGVGQFFPGAGATPAIGMPGRLETVGEFRLETIVPTRLVADVIAALRAAHPYEEPAFDLLPRIAPPGGGIGRIGKLPTPTSRSAIFDSLKAGLGINYLLIAGPTSGDATTVAVCAGACGDLLDHALAARADVYVTGEMRHHDALRAATAGMTVVCTLHSNSERVTLRHLAKKLSNELPAVAWRISTSDRDPFSIE